MSNGHDEVEIEAHNSSRPPPKALGINVERPKFPQYAVYSKRLDSYKSWPEYIPLDKNDLVEAGLVYTGVGDSVRCYFCGGGLRNWEYGDVPMEEHAKWYPTCPHILLVKGQAYIEKISRGEKPEISSTAESSSKPNEQHSHIESIAAQSCLEMGYKEEMVQKAIDIFINKYGKADFKGKDLCEILLDLEENPDEEAADDNTDCPKTEEDSCLTEEVFEPLEVLTEENLRLKENQMCKICLDNRADVIFLPCGHMVSCPQCAPAMVKCPICIKTVNGQVKALFATLNKN